MRHSVKIRIIILVLSVITSLTAYLLYEQTIKHEYYRYSQERMRLLAALRSVEKKVDEQTFKANMILQSIETTSDPDEEVDTVLNKKDQKYKAKAGMSTKNNAVKIDSPQKTLSVTSSIIIDTIQPAQIFDVDPATIDTTSFGLANVNQADHEFIKRNGINYEIPEGSTYILIVGYFTGKVALKAFYDSITKRGINARVYFDERGAYYVWIPDYTRKDKPTVENILKIRALRQEFESAWYLYYKMVS